MKLNKLPIDIIEKIFDFLNDPLDYRNAASSCQIFSLVAQLMTNKKKKEFRTFIRRPSRSYPDIEYYYYVLPNGNLHGNFQMWLEGTCLINNEYRDNIIVS